MVRNQQTARRGAAAVEFAFVAPLFLIMLFGIIECGRALMVQQLLVNATREGARQAALPEATVDAVKSSVRSYLAASTIVLPEDGVTVTPNPATAFNNEQITVSVEVPYSDVSWLPSIYIMGNLEASTRMRSERLE